MTDLTRDDHPDLSRSSLLLSSCSLLTLQISSGHSASVRYARSNEGIEPLTLRLDGTFVTLCYDVIAERVVNHHYLYPLDQYEQSFQFRVLQFTCFWLFVARERAKKRRRYGQIRASAASMKKSIPAEGGQVL